MTVFRAFATAIRALGNLRVWVPLLLYLALKVALIFVYTKSHHGPLASLWEVMLPETMREAVSHYPGHVLVMPMILGRVDIVLDVLVNVVFQGATVFLFAWVLRRQSPSVDRAFRHTLARYVPAITVTFFATALLYGVFFLPDLLAPVTGGIPPIAVTGTVALAGLVVQTFFIFTLPLVLLAGLSVTGALRESLSLARGAFISTLVLVTVPFVVTLPLVLLEAKSELLVARLSPDILVHLQIAKELAQWLSTLILIGGLTAYYLQRKGADAVRST